MEFDFKKLNPEFAIKLKNLISNLKGKGFLITPVVGFLSLEEQAINWTKIRKKATINTMLDHLRANEAYYSADVLEKVQDYFYPAQWWDYKEKYIYDYHLLGKACKFTCEQESNDFYKVVADQCLLEGLMPGYHLKKPILNYVRLEEIELEDVYSDKELDDLLKEINNS